MADALRRIDTKPYRNRFSDYVSADPGPEPTMEWISIVSLRVDATYQRHVLRAGEKNILSIAKSFEWAKFTPVIVAPIGGGLFAIIDGQHRTTAAALRGFAQVPCMIVTADARKQAEAFVAVNGNVTAMSALQLHVARVAAGEPKALAIAEVCARADVTICKYPVPGNKMKAGETLAVGSLKSAFEKYGADVLVAALSCITKTRQGNPGMIRAAIVDALCAVLEAEPSWYADQKLLIRAMQTFDFVAGFNAARTRSIEDGCTITNALVDSVGDHLETKLSVAA